jgi:Spy/CpxP family protein refolding chaperone
MASFRNLSVLVMALMLAAAFVPEAQAQASERSRRGFGRGMSRGSYLGLLRMEQVQKELKLSEEQVTKVATIGEELRESMREQYTALRDIEDRGQRREKMTELSAQFDQKAREKLGDVLEKEQMTRLNQIRMQVRAVMESLDDKDVAKQLKLTEEQQKKLAQIKKDTQIKQSELYGTMRGASREQRTEVFQKLRKIRNDADKQALELLTAEQKEAFEKMKGDKIELPMRRGQR